MFRSVDRKQHPNRADRSTIYSPVYQRNRVFHKRPTIFFTERDLQCVLLERPNIVIIMQRTVNEAPSGNARYLFRLDNDFSAF